MAISISPSDADKEWAPIENYFYRIPKNKTEKIALIGSKCKHCEEIYFPKTPQCLVCHTETTEDIELDRIGNVYSSTIVHLAPPLYQGKVPYMVGHVVLNNGVLIPTRFQTTSNTPLTVGTKVELSMEKLGKDEEGRDIMVHTFKPVQE